MEARDPQAKIRPLPPAATRERPPDPHRPWWVSALFALVGLAVFAVVAAVLGTRAGNDAEAPEATVATTFDAALASPPATTTTTPPASTTTSTLPPTLSRIAPGLEYSLMIYATEVGGASVALNWNLSSPVPQESTLLARTAELAHSADGRRFAYLAASRVEGTLFLGSTPLFQEGIALRVTGFAWHGTEPDRLAWTARDPDSGATVLHAATVDDGGVVDVAAVATVDPGARLIGWGDWGYAVEWVPLDDPQFVMIDDAIVPLTIATIFDADGVVRHRIPLDVLAVSPQGRFIAENTQVAFDRADIDVSLWDVETREFGDARLLYDADLQVVDAFPPIRGNAFVLFSPDGEQVVQVFATPNDTTVVNTISIDLLTYRAASLGTFATPVGFVDAERIALNAAEGDLIILDWDKGTTWRVPLRPDLFVLDVVYR